MLTPRSDHWMIAPDRHVHMNEDNEYVTCYSFIDTLSMCCIYNIEQCIAFKLVVYSLSYFLYSHSRTINIHSYIYTTVTQGLIQKNERGGG